MICNHCGGPFPHEGGRCPGTPASTRESIIRYLEAQAEGWARYDLTKSRVWSKASRHIREKRDIEEGA